ANDRACGLRPDAADLHELLLTQAVHIDPARVWVCHGRPLPSGEPAYSGPLSRSGAARARYASVRRTRPAPPGRCETGDRARPWLACRATPTAPVGPCRSPSPP